MFRIYYKTWLATLSYRQVYVTKEERKLTLKFNVRKVTEKTESLLVCRVWWILCRAFLLHTFHRYARPRCGAPLSFIVKKGKIFFTLFLVWKSGSERGGSSKSERNKHCSRSHHNETEQHFGDKKKTTCAKDLYVLFSVFLVPFTGVLGREEPRRRKWVSVSVSLNYIKGFL